MKRLFLATLAVTMVLSAAVVATDGQDAMAHFVGRFFFAKKTPVCPDPTIAIPTNRTDREKLNARCTEGPTTASLYGSGEPLPKAMDPVTDPAILRNVPAGVKPVYVGVTGTISYRGPKGERLEAHNQPLFADREFVKAITLANDKIAKAKNDPNARVKFVNEDPAANRQNALGRTIWQGQNATGFTAGARSLHVRTQRAADIENWSDPVVRAALKDVGIIRSGDHSTGMNIADPDHHQFDDSYLSRNDRLWDQRKKP